MQCILATKERLLKWSVVGNFNCVLCRNGDHLFFDCSHSRAVWMEILRRNHVYRGPYNWEEEKNWFLLHSKGKTLKKSVLKISLAAAVYGIWCERNLRIFQQKSLEAAFLGSKVCNNIRDAKLAWRKIRSTQKNKVLCRTWGVPLSILRPSAAVG